MQYAASHPFHGDRKSAFGLAETALTATGFRITHRDEELIEFEGPGMHSNRQNALLGATDIRIVAGRDELAVEAELGGVARMSRFVMIFPIGLTLFLSGVLSAVFAVRFGPGNWMAAVAAFVGANAVIWLILGPIMARSMQARTNHALDALLANMVTVGEGSQRAVNCHE